MEAIDIDRLSAEERLELLEQVWESLSETPLAIRLRHTFASWYMMNGGDLYELAKILGHSNIKMTERYAKLARHHIAKTGNTAREMWGLLRAGYGQSGTGTR